LNLELHARADGQCRHVALDEVRNTDPRRRASHRHDEVVDVDGVDELALAAEVQGQRRLISMAHGATKVKVPQPGRRLRRRWWA